MYGRVIYTKLNIDNFPLGRGWGPRGTTQPSSFPFTSVLLGHIFGRGSVDGRALSIWCCRTCLEITAPTFNKTSQAFFALGATMGWDQNHLPGLLCFSLCRGDLLPLTLLCDLFLISLPPTFMVWVLDQGSHLPLFSCYFTQNLCLENAHLSWVWPIGKSILSLTGIFFIQQVRNVC